LSFLNDLQEAPFESFQTVRRICRVHRLLFCDRDLPRRILDWIDQERDNPHFELDVATSPHQVTLAKTRTTKLLMYVWFRPADHAAPDAAHDHSSLGVSLIHTGHCYDERQYAQCPDGTVSLIARHRASPGDIRIIRPETMHIVEPSPSGGFSFILWGPRIRHTTTVLNIIGGSRTSEYSEHVDNVQRLLAVANSVSAEDAA